jgi:hypothetical protein
VSVMLKTRPRSTTPTKPAQPVDETETGLSCKSPILKKLGSGLEAPEDAIRDSEPPESWEEWETEAPDAGRGECSSIDQDFTHGRSRS